MTMRRGEKDRRDFFVSFNSADRDYAEWIAAELEAAGKTVFFQHWDFRPGNNFILEMDRAARLADRTIAVLSESYLEALYTQPEWAKEFADDPTGAGRRLIPVRVQECDVDGLLKAIVYIDLVGCEEAEARKRLREGVREGRAKPEFVAFPGKAEPGKAGGRPFPGAHATSSPGTEAPLVPTREGELRYLDRLVKEIGKTARLYSPLQGVAEIWPDRESDQLLQPWEDDPYIAILRHTSRKEDRGSGEVHEYKDALEAFQKVRRAALLGPPGSGKSTTLRKLATELARVAKGDAGAPLPLLAHLGKWTGDEPLEGFVAAQAPEIGRAVEVLGRDGRLALLFDGLNEMPTAQRVAKAAQVRTMIEKLQTGAAAIVSCRREDYVGDLDLGFDTLTLQELKPWRVRDVLRLWVTSGGEAAQVADRLFWQLAGDEGLAGVLDTWIAAGASEESFWSVADPSENKLAYGKTSAAQDELWRRHMRDPRSLLRLTANPFMLTMLFQVWCLRKGELPKNRADLFGRFVSALLHRERLFVKDETGEWRRTEDGDRLLRGMTDLAWGMQRDRTEAGQGDSGDFGVLTVASRDAALKTIGDAALLKKALDGTLLEGDQEIRFRHQLLQEYFTAQALRGQMAQMKAAELWPPDRWWERSGWEETAVLLAGFYSDDCSPVIRWLWRAQPEVAAQCIQESGAEVANKEALLRELQTAWLPRLTDMRGEPRPEARAALGRALGRLELDNRKGVGVKDGIPDIDWVRIPGAEFPYQEKGRRKVETFYMARYVVTNAQYEVFLNAGDGYGDDRWWKGLTGPDRTRGQPGWSESNHPRERVSWHEAMAFCAWLSDKAGFEIRLPTEWEWERAARSTDGRRYPWGERYRPGHANINETWDKAGTHYLRRTSAVGIYPEGASPEGVEDLAGNVWEWCLNEYERPDRTQRSGTKPRVLRGGSWNNNQDNARADYRNNNHPNNRNNNIGFRVVCSSHIHLQPSICRRVQPIKVGGMGRRAAGWRGPVRSARCACWTGRRRAHTKERRRLDVHGSGDPVAPRSSLSLRPRSAPSRGSRKAQAALQERVPVSLGSLALSPLKINNRTLISVQIC